MQRQGDMLMQFILPIVPSCEWSRLDFEEEVWALVPPHRKHALSAAYLSSYAVGTLRNCRLALARLRAWR